MFRTRRLAAIAGATVLALSLLGCQTVGSWFAKGTGDAVVATSTAQPGDAQKLGEAERLFTSAANITDAIVQSANLSTGTLQAIDGYRAKAHDALVQLRADHAAGRSIDLSALNAALKTWLDYANAQKK
jgi:hypothetical protein